ncbi:ERF4 family protein [Aspergillus vadensis CBS 113365]|uniref:Ras modification protein ERF4 n=1 Tax=Aspergillus vadensis (strain CBS 113365 / IMI 142717 / IBT 24658) TaxID=1448311 RepID=A0A319B8F8_ASPVC|nr:hypothetical protein BO88DRAFT_444330 [Aspergillus vadensis CBS 113365]PYH68639.1 hypothetical protein BO88DRAFT_444330 [Aspergillus vadensis CBS 113365]
MASGGRVKCRRRKLRWKGPTWMGANTLTASEARDLTGLERGADWWRSNEFTPVFNLIQTRTAFVLGHEGAIHRSPCPWPSKRKRTLDRAVRGPANHSGPVPALGWSLTWAIDSFIVSSRDPGGVISSSRSSSSLVVRENHLLSLAAPLFDPHPPIKAAHCDRFLSLGHRHHFLILPPQRLSSPHPPRPLRHLSAPRGPLGRFPHRKRPLSPHKRTLQHHRPRLKKHPLIPREASAFGAIPSRHIPPHPPISSWIPPTILRPPSVRLANPVNYVPRNTPVTVPHLSQLSDENLPLDAHRDAYPLLTIPERRRSRPIPSPNSLVVERSQGETESGRSSIAVPRGQRRSGAFDDQLVLQEMSESGVSNGAPEVKNPRAPERAHLGLDLAVDGPGPLHDDRPRHIQSQSSLRSQSHIASVPSITGAQNGGEADVAEELAWGPAHPCYPHINPHVPIGSEEYMTTRIIRIRRDWMIKGDLAPTFSNLYPEILDPLLPEQEFRKVIATVNDELVKAFDPFSLRNFIDSALSLLTGWIWEDIGAPGIKSHLKRVEAWLERWNREVGAKDGVHIWSLRRTAYMSLDIQIPDPKVGIIRSEGVPSLPGTRPSSGPIRSNNTISSIYYLSHGTIGDLLTFQKKLYALLRRSR